MLCPEVLGKLTLELMSCRTGGEPLRLQHLLHGGHFLSSNGRPMKLNKWSVHIQISGAYATSVSFSDGAPQGTATGPDISLHRPSVIRYLRAQAGHCPSPVPFCNRIPQLHIHPICLAGTPPISAWSGTSRVTTAPAPTKQYFPNVMPHTTVAFAPMEAPRLTNVCRYSLLRTT